MRRTAFTIKSTAGIARVLSTDVLIVIPGTSTSAHVKAIWDTGATGTAITTNVVKALGLLPTGQSHVSTAAGVVLQNTYSINVTLPNSLTVEGIVATEVPALSGGCEALIGMDIITLGDLSITNHDNVTCMSFRVPSSHEIDYVKSPDFGIVKITHADSVSKAARALALKNQAANKAKKKRR